MTLPFVVLKAAVSLDGRLDHIGPARLVLSSPEDLDRADAERSAADAVLVGAGTVRRDDPTLLVKAPWRVAARVAAGRPPQPLRVVLAGGGVLPATARVFSAAAPTWAVTGRPPLPAVLAALAGHGVRRLLVEAGGAVGRSFLAADLADELQLSFAPFLLGAGPAFAPPAEYPQAPGRPLRLVAVENLGGLAAATYRRGPAGEERDAELLRRAADLAGRCPPSAAAFAVGALLATAGGDVAATGYSRETGPAVHAEEVAFAKAAALGVPLAGGTLYSSLEPCGERKSGAMPCVDRILAAGLRRVVFAAFEPPWFVVPCGARRLAAAGVELRFLPGVVPPLPAEPPSAGGLAEAPGSCVRRHGGG